MHQVLFFLPVHANFLDPRGVPVYGFGAMLFLTFVVTAMVWGPSRGLRVGMPDGRMVDLAIVLFLGGIAGARVVYMLQYRDQFGPGLIDYVQQFFQFWKGGIVVYGAVFGGLLGYALFHRLVLRRLLMQTAECLLLAARCHAHLFHATHQCLQSHRLLTR